MSTPDLLYDTSDQVQTPAQRRRRNADAAKVRRAKRAALGICLDQPENNPHGPIYKGGRCRACYDAAH